MKFYKLFSILLSSGLIFTSCNLDTDDDNNYVTQNFVCSNLVIPADGASFATNANYSLTFYYNSGNVVVGTSDLSLGYGNFNFSTDPMPAETKLYTIDWSPNTLDVTTFQGGKANNNGTLVQNLKGYTSSIVNLLSTNDPNIPEYPFRAQIPLVISYNVNYDYTVKTFMPDAIYRGETTVITAGSTAEPFKNKDIRYRVIFSTDYKKADVIFYNANFSASMPVTINFILQNLDVEFLKNGYRISGASLIPSLYEGGALTPYPAIPINSFELLNTSDDLSSCTMMYTVQMGKAIYNVDFNGYYVLSGEQK